MVGRSDMASSGSGGTDFDETYQHLDALYSTALRLTRRSDQADDLVQDTYLKAFRLFHRFQPGTNLKAWLFTILMNSFRNHLRKTRRTPQQVDYDNVEPFLELIRARHSPGSKTPEEEYFEFAAVEQITGAIEKLPEPFREVIQLACVEQFHYKEICEILDVPMGTVMSRIYRGRKLLQKMLLDQAKRAGVVK